MTQPIVLHNCRVNGGRAGVNTNMRRIGQNVNPITVKFSGKDPQDL